MIVACPEALGPSVVVVLAVPALALLADALTSCCFVRRPPPVPASTVTGTLTLLLISPRQHQIQIPMQE